MLPASFILPANMRCSNFGILFNHDFSQERRSLTWNEVGEAVRVNEVTPLSLIYRLISAVCGILCSYSEPLLLTLHCVTLKRIMCFFAFEFYRHFNVLFAFLSHCKDSISVPFQTNTFRSFTQRRNLYLEEQRKVGVHVFRHHISCRTACTVVACWWW